MPDGSTVTTTIPSAAENDDDFSDDDNEEEEEDDDSDGSPSFSDWCCCAFFMIESMGVCVCECRDLAQWDSVVSLYECGRYYSGYLWLMLQY